MQGHQLQRAANVQLDTPAEYARHRKVSREAVRKWLAAGRIPFKPDGKKKLIDRAAADLAFGDTIQRLASEPQAPLAPDEPAAPSLTKARADQAHYGARLAELQYKRELGKSVDTEDVAAAAGLCGEEMVRAVTQIHNHAERLLAAANKDGLTGLRAVCKSIERDLLQKVSAAFAKLAALSADNDEAEAELVDDTA